MQAAVFEQKVGWLDAYLDDGTRVYRDEETGQFYNESDQKIAVEDEIEARLKYSRDDSSRQAIKSGKERLDILFNERQNVVEFQEKQNERKQRLKDHPEEADQIEEEIRNSSIPDRVQRIHDRETTGMSRETRHTVSTSITKDHLPEGSIESELALSPAFRHAVGVEQPGQQHAQHPDLEKEITSSRPGMTLG
jgi:hypothetical protein